VKALTGWVSGGGGSGPDNENFPKIFPLTYYLLFPENSHHSKSIFPRYTKRTILKVLQLKLIFQNKLVGAIMASIILEKTSPFSQ
jgi:hypothetical protein